MIIVTITTISSPVLSSQRPYFLLFRELDYVSSASSYLDRENLEPDSWIEGGALSWEFESSLSLSPRSLNILLSLSQLAIVFQGSLIPSTDVQSIPGLMLSKGFQDDQGSSQALIWGRGRPGDRQ